MSEQIKKIFEEYKDTFLAKGEEIKAFLLKYYEKVFLRQAMLKLERIDATERIKTSGFQKHLSSWRNTYDNIVISTCTVIDGVEKRYDYKFFFTEEVLDDKSVEQIEDEIKEINKLKRSFKFEECLSKIDVQIKIIKEKNDKYYDKRLTELQNDVLKAEKDYEKNCEEFEKLEQEVSANQESNDLAGIISNCQAIIELSKVLRKSNEVKMYSEILKQAESELSETKATEENIKQLEDEVKKARDVMNFEEVISNCEQIIELCKTIDRKDLEEKYSKMYEEASKVVKEKEERDQEIKRIEQDIQELEEKLKASRETENLEEAASDCEKIIELSNSIHRNSITEKYQAELVQINKKILERKTLKEQRLLKGQEESEREKRDKDDKYRKAEVEKELKEKAKEFENVVDFGENVIPIVDKFPVNEIIGDLSDDIDVLLGQLGSLLSENRVDIKNEISNKVLLTSSSGETVEFEKEIEIKKSEEEDVISFNVQSGLTNPFDDTIEEAILTDIIPYNYEISRIELNGRHVRSFPDNTLTKDGLQLNWEFQDIPPEGKIEIKYDLRKRVSRTIIFILEGQVTIIKTHSDLKYLDLEGFYEADLPFTNTFRTILKGAIVEDIIPIYYIHYVDKPRDLLPDARERSEIGELVKWNIGTMAQETKDYNYKLIEIYKFEELKKMIQKLDEEGFKALDIDDLTHSMGIYRQITDFLKDYIK